MYTMKTLRPLELPFSNKQGQGRQGMRPIISSSRWSRKISTAGVGCWSSESWKISTAGVGCWSSESWKEQAKAYPKLRMRSSSSSTQTLIRKSMSPTAACSSSGNIEEEDGGADVPAVSTLMTTWVEKYIPKKARPYAYLMRLQHLSASAVIFLPCSWSIAFATQPGNFADVKLLALFSFVGVVHHGIGCTINDILDLDIDAKVKRTKHRPLASGVLTIFQGLSFLGLQMLLCYCLLLQVNDLSRKLWLASMVLVFTYPLTKRVTFWAQAYLGLAINFFNLCGWSAVKGSLDLRILLPLCTSGAIWTIIYDTIYSHQDKDDDAKIGVKSLALLLGNSTKIWLCCFAAACIGALVLTGSLASIGWPYYASLVAASSHFVWQITTVDLDSPADCLMKFDSNKQFGVIVLCGILLGRLYP